MMWIYLEGPVEVADTADPERLRAIAEAEASMFATDNDLTRHGAAIFHLEVPQFAGLTLAQENDEGVLVHFDHIVRVEFEVEDHPTFENWARPEHWNDARPVCADCAAKVEHSHDEGTR